MMQSENVALLRNLAQLRGLFIAQTGTTILTPLLFVMIFWMTSIFLSWGLFSPANAVSVTTFFVAALCVAGAIFRSLKCIRLTKDCCAFQARRSASPMILFYPSATYSRSDPTNSGEAR
jgi:hypothetical protein